jgi:hypothetical protein
MLGEIIGLRKEKPVIGAERERFVDPGPNSLEGMTVNET